jgi:hypothetical protein
MSTGKLPPSLLAPRYSHLLEEAVAVRDGLNPDASPSASIQSDPHGYEAPSNSGPLQEPPILPPTGIGKRVKGFISSYLPTRSKPVQPTPKVEPLRPGLPLPPPGILEKPRGPISTPVRPLPPRPAHPKELVHLQPAPPPKAAPVPTATKPRRLVELHPTPQPSQMINVQRPRRSSSGSVKDLVRSFQELEDRQAMECKTLKKLELKKVKSIGYGRRGWGGKPGWRP